MTDEEKELIKILTEQSNNNIALINNQNEALIKSEEQLLEMHKKCNKINLIILAMSLLTCIIIICFFIFSYFFSNYDSSKNIDIQNKSCSESINGGE